MGGLRRTFASAQPVARRSISALRKHRGWVTLGLAIVAVAAALSVRPTASLVTAEIQTEHFAYTPSIRERAIFSLPAARVENRTGVIRCVEDLSIDLWTGEIPVRMVVRHYQFAPDRLELTFEGGQPGLTARDGSTIDFEDGYGVISVDGADDACNGSEPFRLALLGEISVGQAGGPDVLRTASLRVFGRSARHFIGIPLAVLPGLEPNALFSADEIELPAGSEILCAATWGKSAAALTSGAAHGCPDVLHGRGAIASTSWWGFADVSLDADRNGRDALSLSLASNADLILFTAPAPPPNSGAPSTASAAQAITNAPDVVSLSLGSKIVGDPNLRILGGALLVVIGLAAGIVQVVSRRGKSRE